MGTEKMPLDIRDGYAVIKDSEDFKKFNHTPVPQLEGVNGIRRERISHFSAALLRLFFEKLDKAHTSLVQAIQIVPDGDMLISKDGIVYSRNGSTLMLCPAGRKGSVTVAEGTRAINDKAFAHSQISEVTLPGSVEEICASAFLNCTMLAAVKTSGSLAEIGEAAFYNCRALASFEEQPNLVSIGDSAFAYSGLREMPFPSSLRYIEGLAFFGCPMEKAVLARDVWLGESCFADVKQLAVKNYNTQIIRACANPYEMGTVELSIDGELPLILPRYLTDATAADEQIRTYLDTKNPGDANLAPYALHEADRYQAALLQYRYTKAQELKSYLHKNAAGIAVWAAKEGEEKLLETIRAVPWDTAARAAFLDVSQARKFVAASAAILELQRQTEQKQETRFQL